MLPLSSYNSIKAIKWLKQNFSKQIKESIYGTPWTEDVVIGIALQETAYKWLRWIDKYSADIILQRCVFDTSGDYPNTSRMAFPKNISEFKDAYGIEFTNMLVNEYNKERAMPQPDNPNGYSPSALYLAKGYGIFQYDLQNIVNDREFFEQKKWYNFSDCMWKLISILNQKANISDNLFGIIKNYNGSGSAAIEYANNVIGFMKISSSVSI